MDNINYDKAFDFSVRIVNLCKYLQSDHKEYVISKQIMRSGTSIAANLKESNYAQSRKDFLHKTQIALKEAAETEYWIDLLLETEYIDQTMHQSLKSDITEILKMLTATVKTIKKSMTV